MHRNKSKYIVEYTNVFKYCPTLITSTVSVHVLRTKICINN